jgi:hypothetical protein
VIVGQIERFERWRVRQARRTADLARRVLDEIVPLYEAAEFKRYDDYAQGDVSVVGANTIALQRRTDARWATIEIQFHRRGKPSFNIIFSALPEVCYRLTTGSPVPIHRKQANVVEGGEYFSLCKGLKRDFDCTFGVPLFALFPDRKIDRDFQIAKDRSQFLIELFHSGIPESWADASPGYVLDYVFKSSHRFRK